MYAKIDIYEHVQTLHHLSSDQEEKLAEVLQPHSEMYEGTIGTLLGHILLSNYSVITQ